MAASAPQASAGDAIDPEYRVSVDAILARDPGAIWADFQRSGIAALGVLAALAEARRLPLDKQPALRWLLGGMEVWAQRCGTVPVGAVLGTDAGGRAGLSPFARALRLERDRFLAQDVARLTAWGVPVALAAELVAERLAATDWNRSHLDLDELSASTIADFWSRSWRHQMISADLLERAKALPVGERVAYLNEHFPETDTRERVLRKLKRQKPCIEVRGLGTENCSAWLHAPRIPTSSTVAPEGENNMVMVVQGRKKVVFLEVRCLRAFRHVDKHLVDGEWVIREVRTINPGDTVTLKQDDALDVITNNKAVLVGSIEDKAHELLGTARPYLMGDLLSIRAELNCSEQDVLSLLKSTGMAPDTIQRIKQQQEARPK